jgi:hypothetical protein
MRNRSNASSASGLAGGSGVVIVHMWTA